MGLGSGSGVGESWTPFLVWSFWSAYQPGSLGIGCLTSLSKKGKFSGVATENTVLAKEQG